MSVRHIPSEERGDIPAPELQFKTEKGCKCRCGTNTCVCGEDVSVPYKFHEGELLEEIKAYIDATYSQHYSRTKFQASEFIFDGGHGVGMNVGCIMKYAQRYGKKDGYNRKDIMKIIHYAILLLYVHDEYIAKESK